MAPLHAPNIAHRHHSHGGLSPSAIAHRAIFVNDPALSIATLSQSFSDAERPLFLAFLAVELAAYAALSISGTLSPLHAVERFANAALCLGDDLFPVALFRLHMLLGPCKLRKHALFQIGSQRRAFSLAQTVSLTRLFYYTGVPDAGIRATCALLDRTLAAMERSDLSASIPAGEAKPSSIVRI